MKGGITMYDMYSFKQSLKRLMTKYIAVMLCVCIIVTSILSAVFILIHANHQHDHDGLNGTCATCMHLATAENLLKQFSTTIVATTFSFVFHLFIFCCPKSSAPYVGLFTLVSLKVRLDR
jgi:preprotein translocase subunit SecG